MEWKTENPMDLRLPLEPNFLAPEDVRLEVGLMTEGELAGALGVNESTLAQWRKAKASPPHLRIGRSIFYTQLAVRAWISCMEDEQYADIIAQAEDATVEHAVEQADLFEGGGVPDTD